MSFLVSTLPVLRGASQRNWQSDVIEGISLLPGVTTHSMGPQADVMQPFEYNGMDFIQALLFPIPKLSQTHISLLPQWACAGVSPFWVESF